MSTPPSVWSLDPDLANRIHTAALALVSAELDEQLGPSAPAQGETLDDRLEQRRAGRAALRHARKQAQDQLALLVYGPVP